MGTTGFEVLEHTADVGFLARSETVEGLFAEAVKALLTIAVEEGVTEEREGCDVQLTADSYGSLLVRLLDEVLYLFDSDRFATTRCVVREVSSTELSATLFGEPRVPTRHRWRLIIKAVTYHGLAVEEVNGLWTAKVILDV